MPLISPNLPDVKCLQFTDGVVTAAGVSLRGPDHYQNDTSRQDDFSIVLSPYGFGCLVADGLGSEKNSHYGSSVVAKSFSEIAKNLLSSGEFQQKVMSEDAKKFALDIVIAVKEDLVSNFTKQNITTDTVTSCKTTLIGFLSNGQHYLSFNLGDGVSFLCSSDLVPNPLRLLNPTRIISGLGVDNIFSNDLFSKVHAESGELPVQGSLVAATDGMDAFFVNQSILSVIHAQNYLDKILPTDQNPDSVSRIMRSMREGEKIDKTKIDFAMHDDKTLVILNWDRKKSLVSKNQNQMPNHLPPVKSLKRQLPPSLQLPPAPLLPPDQALPIPELHTAENSMKGSKPSPPEKIHQEPKENKSFWKKIGNPLSNKKS